MSTIRTKNISHPSADTSAITLNADGSMGGSFPAPNRNLLYNGAMQVHQRGTSTTGITTGGYYTADRWNHGNGTLGTWTDSVENDAPTGTGLRKSYKTICTTADSTPAAGDARTLETRLEGQDVQRIAKGTSEAQELALSFWVKSNATGNYVAEIRDIDNARSVSAQYSISASATWEKKTIVFPADTNGILDNDNAESLRVTYWLAAGSNFTSGTLADSWGSLVSANRAVGQTNLAAATNNYWQITGVQLETGPVATDFEFEPYGVTLAKCQRYYWRTSSQQSFSYHGVGSFTTTTNFNVHINHPVTMRTRPTSVETSNVTIFTFADVNFPITSISLQDVVSSTNTSRLQAVVSGATVGVGGFLFNNNNANGYVAFSAEL